MSYPIRRVSNVAKALVFFYGPEPVSAFDNSNGLLKAEDWAIVQDGKAYALESGFFPNAGNILELH